MNPASPYRLIAIDLDGTLLAPTGSVTPRTRAAVHRAVAAGFLVCFATGRSWRESRHIVDWVGHYGGAVFVTGAMVVDTHAKVMLRRSLMDAELARQLSRFFESRGHAVLALQDEQQAGVDYMVTDAVELNSATQGWLKMTRTEVRRSRDLRGDSHEHTIRISIVADDTDVERCERELREEFGMRAFCHGLTVPSTGLRVLEVFDPAVNKWDGVMHIAGRHGVAARQVVAIGDDVNDLPMITAAGLGVAMGNGKSAVREAAARVIGSNSEDGLAEFLEELAGEKTF